MSRYLLNVRCDMCDAVFCRDELSSSHYNCFANNVCVECGHHGFHDRVERWVETGHLLKPWTWGSGYWEEAK